MKSYLIHAHSPLVFRSGRPFGAQSDTDDIIFPLPSSAAGLVRAQIMQQRGYTLNPPTHPKRVAHISPEQHTELQNIACAGLFLTRYHTLNDTYTVLVPKPADALYLKNEQSGETELVHLAPEALKNPDNEGSNLPDGLLPVCITSHLKGKPQSGNTFWTLADSLAWQHGNALSFADIDQRGYNAPTYDTRTHVQINRLSQAAEDGKLFQTAAYDLNPSAKKPHQGWEDEAYAFLVRTPATLDSGLVQLGGERRLSQLQPVATTAEFDSINQHSTVLSQAIQQQKGLRLTLLTPAIFGNGYLPAWLDNKREGTIPHTQVKVRLRAAAIERWQAVSGWDLHQHKPKAMRKAVAAGAVYWFEYLAGDLNTLAHAAFQAISDDEQDQRDGFGIVSIAPWKNI